MQNGYMKKFNLKDKVVWIKSPLYYKNFTPPIKCIVRSISDGNRIQIEIIGVLNTQGTNMKKWISSNEIEIDKEYYRDLKINALLG